jgi:hypothetical protein
LDGLSIRISMRLTSFCTSEATRATICAGAASPKLMLSNCSQSPPLTQPTFLPPPSSPVSCTPVPCCATAFSAWIGEYASMPTGAAGAAEVGGGGEGDGESDRGAGDVDGTAAPRAVDPPCSRPTRKPARTSATTTAAMRSRWRAVRERDR